MYVGGRKTLVGGYECTMQLLYIYWSRIFHAFLLFKRGILAVSSITMPLPVLMLRIHSIVILELTIKSLKMKQMVVFFCFAVSSSCALN